MQAARTAVDLFAGSGGLSEGLRQAGFEVVAAVERDQLAAEAYRQNHVRTLVWDEDIRRFAASDVRKKLQLNVGELDLLAGCPPCQGFSNLRTLNGSRTIDDPRNGLVVQFIHYAQEFLPKAVMMENVPALADDAGLKKLLRSLRSLGYHTKSHVVDVAQFGVPQRRARFVMLAGLGGAIQWPAKVATEATVRSAIADLPRAGDSGDALHDYPERRSSKIAKLIRKIPKDGGSRSSLPDHEQLDCHKKSQGFYDVYGRMHWDKVAPTITTGCVNPSKGRFLHPEENRAITLREAALLQGFPPDYKFPLRKGKYAVAEMIGNALPPEFARRYGIKVGAFIDRLEANEPNSA